MSFPSRIRYNILIHDCILRTFRVKLQNRHFERRAGKARSFFVGKQWTEFCLLSRGVCGEDREGAFIITIACGGKKRGKTGDEVWTCPRKKKKRGIVEKRERARSTSGLHPPSPSELLQLAIAKQKQDRGEEGETEVSGASTSMMKS